MPDDFHWLNPPDDWSGDAARLELRTDGQYRLLARDVLRLHQG